MVPLSISARERSTKWKSFFEQYQIWEWLSILRVHSNTSIIAVVVSHLRYRYINNILTGIIYFLYKKAQETERRVVIILQPRKLYIYIFERNKNYWKFPRSTLLWTRRHPMYGSTPYKHASCLHTFSYISLSVKQRLYPLFWVSHSEIVTKDWFSSS